jgi:hypothetical protein
LLNGLTSTPYDPANGVGEGLCEGKAEGLAEGELVRDELAAGDGEFAVPAPGRLQAAATSRPSIPTAAARKDVFTAIKGNDTLRFGLRFRYDPAPEAGHRPSPSGHRSKGSRLWRMASGRPLLFYSVELEE